MGVVRAGWVGMLVTAAACGGAAPARATATAPAAATQPPPQPASSSVPTPATARAPESAPTTATPSMPPPIFSEDTLAPAPAPTPTVTLSSPKKDAVLDPAKAADTEVRFKVGNWKLDATRGVELVLDDRVSLVVKDPTRMVHIKDIDPSSAAVSAGQHLLVALLRGPQGQWVRPAGKGRGPVAVTTYFVGPRSKPAYRDGDPLLVFVTPPSAPVPPDGILVDYYLVNAELGHEKYSIHASVTGPGIMTGKVIDAWKPWRIHGARQGSYTIRLELARYQHDLGESGSSTTVVLESKAVGGPWTSVTHDFDLLPPSRP
jgi:hypothetical protein